MTPFDDHPQFYLADDRQQRTINPITKHSLEWKCKLLLPPEIVANKTILDLGCCLGAMGHWSLSYGAKQYTGVEVQAEFVDKATELLAHWADHITLVQQGIREYLASIDDNAFDIVIGAGILQVFIDPQVIIAEMCRVSREIVTIEASIPQLERKQTFSNQSFMQICTSACNVTGGAHQARGIAGLLSSNALDVLFECYGFTKTLVDYSPPMIDDTCAFTLPTLDEQKPLRIIRRYCAKAIFNKPFLEDAIKHKVGVIETWQQSKRTAKLQQATDENTLTAWTFDDTVAEHFDDIAAKNIVNYSAVLDACLQVLNTADVPTDARIIDVGCATGETLQRLQDAGYTNLVGVDNSPAMLKKVELDDVLLIESAAFPVEAGPFDVILANWTLHFIEDRETYLNAMLSSLSDSGILILTEKTHPSRLMTKLYHDYKRQQGMTEQEIRDKALQIQGVLIPYPVAWYYNMVYQHGGLSVDILCAEYGFVTFLVQQL